MIKRILAAVFGALLFGILMPIAYPFVFDGFPLEGFKGILAVAGGGVALGALLGALFPKVFGFVFELFLEP